MTTAIERRRGRFLRVLAAEKQSQASWARAQGISKAHLSLVLAGKRDSLTLTQKIDAFVTAHGSKPRALAS